MGFLSTLSKYLHYSNWLYLAICNRCGNIDPGSFKKSRYEIFGFRLKPVVVRSNFFHLYEIYLLLLYPNLQNKKKLKPVAPQHPKRTIWVLQTQRRKRKLKFENGTGRTKFFRFLGTSLNWLRRGDGYRMASEIMTRTYRVFTTNIAIESFETPTTTIVFMDWYPNRI